MALGSSQYSSQIQSASTISGTDIVIYLEDTKIIAARSLTLNVTRTKEPVYIHGTANPLGFARGHRLITGTLESALVYSASIAQWFKNLRGEKYSHYALQDVKGMDILTYNKLDGSDKDIAGTAFKAAKYEPLFLDELPPIDITVVGVNELGKAATMRIFGVEFTDYSSSTTVENVINVEALKFVAVHFTPWVVENLEES